MGPRQITAWSSGTKNPIESSRTPCPDGGIIRFSSVSSGPFSTPSMRGIEKPHTSASMAATSLPICASATDRLVVTDDFPTPPLPEATAITRVRAVRKGFSPGTGRPRGGSAHFHYGHRENSPRVLLSLVRSRPRRVQRRGHLGHERLRRPDP